MTTVHALEPIPAGHRILVPDPEAGFGCLDTELGRLPLEALDIDATVTGLVHETRLSQTFKNTFDQPLEATYIFPLPDRAAASGFELVVGERVVKGVVQERGQARANYTAAIEAGHRAAITEEERPGVFTVRVGNLPPGESVQVRLTLTGPVPLVDDEATWRFPLVVAQRYIPGTTLDGAPVGTGVADDTDQVPDASRITPPVRLPGLPEPVALTLNVTLDPSGLAFGPPTASLHTVLVESGGGEASGLVRRLSVQPGEALDRDFILRWPVLGETVTTGGVRGPGAASDSDDAQDNFLVTLVPSAVDRSRVRPRDVIVVLDRSGSMGGWKMVSARRAAGRMIDALGDEDRFAVLAFDHDIETPTGLGDGLADGLVRATDRNRFRAASWLGTLEARGGTEMARPLTLAADLLGKADASRDRVLVLVTDGQVGNESAIVRALKKKLKGLRIFTLGVDQAVNAGFLKRLAAIGGGACELVESEDRVDAVLARIHRRVAAPEVTELSIEGVDGLTLDTASVMPALLPDLFLGAPVRIAGRCSGEGALRVRGKDLTGAAFEADVTLTRTESQAPRLVWARGHLRDLEDRFDAHPYDHGELEARIVETSVTHQVLCRFTAFLAVDEVEVVNEGGENHAVTQSVASPAGWDMLAEEADMDYAAAAMPPPMAMSPSPMMAGGLGGPTGGMPTSAPKRAMRKKSMAPSFGGGGDALFDALEEGAAAIGRALGLGRKGQGKEAEEKVRETDGFELGGYAETLKQLLDEARGPLDEKGRARLAVELDALAVDLASVDAPERLVESLRRLADAVRTDASDLAERLEAVRTLAAEATDAEAEDGDDDAPARDRFWA